ncbi:MAG TPA: serine/threonine-protein kinase [Gemmatimonadales bacterium]|jgi:serine/threonine-protein kinase
MKTCTVCGAEWPDDTKFCPNDGSTLRSAGGIGDMVGSVVADRYHIQKKLGEGGMGAVYLGEHVKMGRKSAIKVMSQSMANDPEAIARFNREAANAARINHANVCAIYDFGETPDGTIYLAMEYIEGQSLDDLLHAEGALSPDRAIKILRQTADALQAAHDLGIVHRDLKPDNIMLAEGRGGADVVKVVDFGIAKAMGGEEGQNVTKTGLVVGTPEYMSPEQLSGDKLDGRSDIYSLALVFYRMVTGGLPFKADTAQETMIKRLTDDPLPMKAVLPSGDFPDALQGAVDRGLARMPGDRYASAVEFASDAARAVEQMPAARRRESATQLIDSKALIDSEGATALLPKTEVAGARSKGGPPAPATPDTAAPAATPPAPKRKPVLAIAATVVIVAAAGGTAAIMLKGPTPEETGLNGTQLGQDTGNVTGNTAPAPSPTEGSQAASGRDGRQSPPVGGGDPITTPRGGQETGGGTEPAGGGDPVSVANPPAIDSVALDNEVFDFFDAIEESPAQRMAVRQRGQEIANDERVPLNIRLTAAVAVGNAHEGDRNTAEACRWYRRALSLDPGYRPAQLGLTTAGCQ